MANHKCDWVDAFTDQPLRGNGCAVVYDAADLSVETRLAFTRETGLTECAFIVPSTRADFGARFTLQARFGSRRDDHAWWIGPCIAILDH